MVNRNVSPDDPNMKDADIPTIFNPRRVRTPSVVVTEEENPRSVPNGPFTNTASLQHADSGILFFSDFPIADHSSFIYDNIFFSLLVTTNTSAQEVTQTSTHSRGFVHKMRSCKNSCCSRSAKKVS